VKIPLSAPEILESEIEEVVAVLRGSQLSLGPKMEEFEAMVSGYVAQPHGIAVSSGTAGLHLCIRALGIRPGDEVIVPSFTFIAAANAIRYEGATPVFVDIDAASLNLDPSRIEEAITPRTRAILVVHTFGVPAEMRAVLEVARRRNLFVIEDACEALGAEIDGRRVGSFGHAAVFAFYPNKQITTGEGGVIVTADAALARECRAMRNHGRYENSGWHQHEILGFNYRLSEINCALGCTQMRRLESILARREAVARVYHAHLEQINDIVRPMIDLTNGRISWFVYVVRLAEPFTRDQRNEIMHRLHQQGIGCGRYFAPIHTQPAYREYSVRHSLPVTECISERTLALPFFNQLSEPQIQVITDALGWAIQEVSCSTA
jgi:perosamine synthetase